MSSMCSPIKSLVFIDLEATDLPQFRPAITEISLVACSSEHFENDPGSGTETLPRVLHKLTICLNPVKKIAQPAVAITGLDNFLLENEKIINHETSALIQTFLNNLQQPVCLVAHNGSGFDFPLLANSLKNYYPIIDVQCVDSLPIFRKIDEDSKKFMDFIDSELAELENTPEPYSEPTCVNYSSNMDISSSSSIQIEEIRPASPDIFGDAVEIEDDLLTQLTAEAEVKFLSTPDNKHIRPGVNPPPLKAKPKESKIDRSQLKPRRLFKPSYKLTKIFERCFETVPPNAHRAEEDTLILMKCARFHAKDFLLNIPNFVRDLQSYVK